MAQTRFSSIMSLENAMYPILQKAQLYTVQEMLEHWQEIMEESVYQGKVPSSGSGLAKSDTYDRTGGFYRSFKVSDVYMRNRKGESII